MKPFNCMYCKKENNWKGYSFVNKYCDNKCQGLHRQQVWMEENRILFLEGKLNNRKAIKKFVTERDGYSCSICAQNPEHNCMPLVMILDHIDGDASNNKPDNFRLVCPNCDTQLPTYKSRNRGKGRATKGMKWYSPL